MKTEDKLIETIDRLEWDMNKFNSIFTHAGYNLTLKEWENVHAITGLSWGDFRQAVRLKLGIKWSEQTTEISNVIE